jgi:hypothetical protein
VRIERTRYGDSLSANARQRILEATTSLVYFGVFERNAEPLSRARDRIEHVKTLAVRFLRQFHEGASRVDARVFADLMR